MPPALLEHGADPGLAARPCRRDLSGRCARDEKPWLLPGAQKRKCAEKAAGVRKFTGAGKLVGAEKPGVRRSSRVRRRARVCTSSNVQ